MKQHIITLYILVLLLLTGLVALAIEISDINDSSPSSQTQTQVNGEPNNHQLTPNQKCPPNQLVNGITANGDITCVKPFALNSARIEAGTKALASIDCHGHGFVEHGFCTCDPDWTGPECQKQKPIPEQNTPLDEDHDNVPVPRDCDDHDDLVYPGAPDSVDGKDNDCDGKIDEGY